MVEASAFDDLMAHVGSALHAWNQVESGMGLLFTVANTAAEMPKWGAIFDAVVSFEARIAVLDATVAHGLNFSDEEREIWPLLSTRIRKLYKKRHEIAHFSIAHPDDLVSGARISPYFTWNKVSNKTERYLTKADLKVREDRFSQAALAVAWLSERVRWRRNPEGAYRPQLAEPPLVSHLRELLAQKKGDGG
jgi:hypothetical protein